MKTILSFLILLLASQSAFADRFDHSVWDTLLQKHIRVIDQGKATQVDYANFNQDAILLVRYLNQLSNVTSKQFQSWPKSDQLAFLINAYNAWTVELVRHKFSEIGSIKHLGRLFKSPWELPIAQLFGERLTLDEIEHEMIRAPGRYEDYRIHFAVNCASIGCPSLRAQAYTAAQLDQQLEDQTLLFMSDPTRNRMGKQRLEISSLFKWYKKDFRSGWLGIDSLNEFLLKYAKQLGLTPTQKKNLTEGKLRIKYLAYDWNLNDLQ